MIHERTGCLLLDFIRMKRKKRKKAISLWEKNIRMEKRQAKIGRKYLWNIWLNTLLQRTQRTLKTRTKWKQTTQLRNGQVVWKDTSWKRSWKTSTGKDAEHHVSLQRCWCRHTRRRHHTPVPRKLQPLLFIAGSNTKWDKLYEDFFLSVSTKLNIVLSCIQKSYPLVLSWQIWNRMFLQKSVCTQMYLA